MILVHCQLGSYTFVDKRSLSDQKVVAMAMGLPDDLSPSTLTRIVAVWEP